MTLAAQYQGSALSNGNEGSWRTSAGLFPGWLGILQMFEQLFRFCILRRKFQGAFHFLPREIRFFLFQIDSCQQRSNDGGVSCCERGLQLFHGILHLALPAIDFSEPPMRRGIVWIARERGAEFLLSSL